MKMRTALIALALPLVAACGSAAAPAEAPAALNGTRIVVRSSQFGTMLFNAKRQAIYVFSADARRKSNCYRECARLWPPVYTAGEPRAGAGVKPSLLGTIRRRDGRLQVTYAGRPLYYYLHEGPGQVLCHNVDLNGGIWKVVSPSGIPRR
jgi:predicted lipoprotein with Yx(FWY)xxD motif